MLFAGPCTGGSPWNRLNRNMGSLTAHNIQLKAFEYWELWEEFAKCLNDALFIGAMAMLELPRGCDYWRDKRMTDLIRGTDSYTHEFDGCMYGLKSRFRKCWSTHPETMENCIVGGVLQQATFEV